MALGGTCPPEPNKSRPLAPGAGSGAARWETSARLGVQDRAPPLPRNAEVPAAPGAAAPARPRCHRPGTGGPRLQAVAALARWPHGRRRLPLHRLPGAARQPLLAAPDAQEARSPRGAAGDRQAGEGRLQQRGGRQGQRRRAGAPQGHVAVTRVGRAPARPRPQLHAGFCGAPSAERPRLTAKPGPDPGPAGMDRGRRPFPRQPSGPAWGPRDGSPRGGRWAAPPDVAHQ